MIRAKENALFWPTNEIENVMHQSPLSTRKGYALCGASSLVEGAKKPDEVVTQKNQLFMVGALHYYRLQPFQVGRVQVLTKFTQKPDETVMAEFLGLKPMPQPKNERWKLNGGI